MIGLVFFALAWRRSGGNRAQARLAGAVFVLFGASDIVEVQTGAWWRPWWLLAWKTLCVLAMIVLLAHHRREKRRAR